MSLSTSDQPRVVRIGVDVGGTFTDLFAFSEADGQTWSTKVLTTSDNQAEGVIAVVAAAGLDLQTVGFFAHGTTAGTNALIVRNQGPCALITTEGFRDVLEIMRTDRQSGYDLQWRKPLPLVPRRLRFEVTERVEHDGTITTGLDPEHACEVLRRVAATGVRSLAVSLLNSYANPVHEELLRALAAEATPGLLVSLSSEVNPEYREFERTSTVAIDAYIKPVMVRYLRSLAADLREAGLEGPPLVMQGSGGMGSVERAMAKPITTLSSGPAAGAIAAARIAERLGIQNVVTFDVGGTSTDVSLIVDGELILSAQKMIEWGMPSRGRCRVCRGGRGKHRVDRRWWGAEDGAPFGREHPRAGLLWPRRNGTCSVGRASRRRAPGNVPGRRDSGPGRDRGRGRDR